MKETSEINKSFQSLVLRNLSKVYGTHPDVISEKQRQLAECIAEDLEDVLEETLKRAQKLI